jgi:serine/threonine-protein kinase
VHPNVCGVFDFGEADGDHFLAMDFLAGVPLSELLRVVGRSPELRSDPMWVPVIGRVLRDAAEGLHAAHELRDADGRPLGVVHRDVSPQNLFVGFDGTTRVIDFGVAAAADRIHHTATGEVKGKFAYMAPEQVNHQTPDRRVDVWALAVVAWEAFTLRRLFRRDGPAATLYAVLEEPIETPSVLSPRLPSALDAPILAGLARDRDRRTPTAREFGDALRVAIQSTGARLAEPGEVADFLRRALPDREDSLRTRVVTARARGRAALEAETAERKASRSLMVAFVCLAAIGLSAGAWGLRSLLQDPVGDAPPVAHEETAPPPAPEELATVSLPAPTPEPETPASAAPADAPRADEAPPRTVRRRSARGRGEGRSESGGTDLATEW